MGRHVSKVIMVDPDLDAIGMEMSINNQRNPLLKDGLELV